jgi:hypothetical protein
MLYSNPGLEKVKDAQAFAHAGSINKLRSDHYRLSVIGTLIYSALLWSKDRRITKRITLYLGNACTEHLQFKYAHSMHPGTDNIVLQKHEDIALHGSPVYTIYTDPDFFLSKITGSGSNNKRGGKVSCLTYFCSQEFHKIIYC